MSNTIGYQIKTLVAQRLNALSRVTEDMIHAQYQSAIGDVLTSEHARLTVERQEFYEERRRLMKDLSDLQTALVQVVSGRISEKKLTMIDTAKLDAVYAKLGTILRSLQR